MNRHNRPASIRVLQEMMAAANSQYNKTRATQRCYHLTPA